MEKELMAEILALIFAPIFVLGLALFLMWCDENPEKGTVVLTLVIVILGMSIIIK